MHNILLELSNVVILGIFGQWFSWRFRIPSILVLLLTGILVGPVFNLVHVDFILGDLLFPIVSLSVAIILFEGGLQLNIKELKHVGRVVRNLISIGALITWGTIYLAAYYILGMDWKLSILLGSVLVVTGPTVVMPLLKYIRITQKLSSVLRWECVNIDPVGAILAVLVFEFVFITGVSESIASLSITILITILAGLGFGLGSAWLLIQSIKRHWTPEYLQEAITLAFVFLAYNGANFFHEEAGLLAVTVLGIILANQRLIVVEHIIEFKENLVTLLLSALFIFLAARVELSDFALLSDWRIWAFLFVLVFIARPLAVFASTIGENFSFKEKLFLSWMAPRGIVSAAVASLFAIKLANFGFAEADLLVSVTFIVIIFTVMLYGLTGSFVARFTGVTQLNNRGVLIAGAHNFARQLAKTLILSGRDVLLVSTNASQIMDAQSEGLKAMHGNLLSRPMQEETDLHGIGKFLVLTQNDEMNSMIALEYETFFHQGNVFRLRTDRKSKSFSSDKGIETKSRYLFSEDITYTKIMSKILNGKKIKLIEFKDFISIESYKDQNQNIDVLFALSKKGRLIPISDTQFVGSKSIESIIILG